MGYSGQSRIQGSCKKSLSKAWQSKKAKEVRRREQIIEIELGLVLDQLFFSSIFKFLHALGVERQVESTRLKLYFKFFEDIKRVNIFLRVPPKD